jgi:hypothetical protein
MKKALILLFIAGCVLLAAQVGRDRNDRIERTTSYSHTGGKSASGYTKFGGAGGGGGGGGGVSPGTANQIAFYATTGSTVSGDTRLLDDGSQLKYSGSQVCTAANGACGGGGGGGSVGTGIPTPTGTAHSFIFNNSTAISASSGNNSPGGLWSQLGGAFAVGSNVAGAGTGGAGQLAYYALATGVGGGNASLAEDAVSQQGTLNLFGMYTFTGSQNSTATDQIVFLGMSTALYGTLNAVHPAGLIFAFRYAGAGAGGTDTHWNAYVSTDATHFTEVDTGISIDTAQHQWAIAKNGTGGLDYYIDGTKKATIASGSTGFPSGAALNTPVYCVSNIATPSVTHSLFISSIRWWPLE